MTDETPLTEEEYRPRPARSRRRLTWQVRGGLLALALLPMVVFAVAWDLDPYRGGRVWLEEAHTQLGMPMCYFRKKTGLPCPSCGMTSSFALFVRGDLVHSLQANAAGTLLATMSLLFVFWGLLTAVHGRMTWPHSWEAWAIGLLLLFVAMMFLRWVIVLALRFSSA